MASFFTRHGFEDPVFIPRILVRPSVPQRVEDVAYRDDPSKNRDLFQFFTGRVPVISFVSGKRFARCIIDETGISAAVPSFMVVQGDKEGSLVEIGALHPGAYFLHVQQDAYLIVDQDVGASLPVKGSITMMRPRVVLAVPPQGGVLRHLP